MRDQNGSLYFHHYRTNVCPSDEIVAIKDANHLADVLFCDLDEDDEHTIFEFKSGHWAVHLPEEVRDELEDALSYEHKSRRDLIVERVRREPITKQRSQSIVERIRLQSPSAAGR